MKLREVYEQMKLLDLVESQLQFSEIWLGRSPRYFSHLLAENREPGIATLAALAWRLRQTAESMNDSPIRRCMLIISIELHNNVSSRMITDIRFHKSRHQASLPAATLV